MAYHRVLLENGDVMAGINRGVCYLDYKIYFFGGFDGSRYYGDLQIFDLKANEFEEFTELSASNRPAGRHYHYMQSIDPNYLFIYGGINKDSIFSDSFLFNTSTYNWEKIIESQSPGQRYGVCGSLINNLLYILGGYGQTDQNTEQNLDDVWMFDYRSREWSPFNTIGNDRVAGVEWSCVAVNNQLYCVGSETSKLCVLNVISREWKAIRINGTIPAKLERFSLSKNSSGSIYLFGGLGFKAVYNEIYSLDEVNEDFIWHKLECTGNKPSPRHSHAAVCVGEVMFIVGGRYESQYFGDVFAFNHNLGLRWITLNAFGDIPIDRVGHVAHYVKETGKVLVHGGDCRGTVMNDVYLFDYKTHEWTKALCKGESPQLAYHSSVFDEKRNSLVVFGGGNLKECFAAVYVLKLSDMQWGLVRTRKALSARAGHNAFLHPSKDLMIVFGGFIPVEGYTNELWSLNLADPQWEPIQPTSGSDSVPVGRISASCTVYNNSAYIIGGSNIEVVLDDLWKLNLDTWLWERITIYEKTPGSIFGHSGALIDTHIFVLTSESVDSNGRIVKNPTHGTLWSLNLSGNIEWSQYKVEGVIPPKRFHAAVLVTNDMLVYGGGPDSNVYQLDRNDVVKDATSDDVFRDFVLPYAHMVEKHRKKKKSSSDEEDKFWQFSGLEEKYSRGSKDTGSSKGSKASKRSQEGKVEEKLQKVKLLPRKKKLK